MRLRFASFVMLVAVLSALVVAPLSPSAQTAPGLAVPVNTPLTAGALLSATSRHAEHHQLHWSWRDTACERHPDG